MPMEFHMTSYLYMFCFVDFSWELILGDFIIYFVSVHWIWQQDITSDASRSSFHRVEGDGLPRPGSPAGPSVAEAAPAVVPPQPSSLPGPTRIYITSQILETETQIIFPT